MENPALYIDQTLLQPLATPAAIEAHCEEAVEFGFKAVCIPPSYVRLAVAQVYGSGVEVATVVGFPLGYETTTSKLFAATEAVDAGASEIDLVIHQGMAASGNLSAIENEVSQLAAAIRPAQLKVIIECCHLTDARKRELTEMLVNAGAGMVKTSTGMAGSGATLADVELLVSAAAGRIGVKAAGGIRTWEFCRQLLAAGATRIGTSSGPAIVRQWQADSGMVK